MLGRSEVEVSKPAFLPIFQHFPITIDSKIRHSVIPMTWISSTFSSSLIYLSHILLLYALASSYQKKQIDFHTIWAYERAGPIFSLLTLHSLRDSLLLFSLKDKHRSHSYVKLYVCPLIVDSSIQEGAYQHIISDKRPQYADANSVSLVPEFEVIYTFFSFRSALVSRTIGLAGFAYKEFCYLTCECQKTLVDTLTHRLQTHKRAAQCMGR